MATNGISAARWNLSSSQSLYPKATKVMVNLTCADQFLMSFQFSNAYILVIRGWDNCNINVRES